MTTAIFTSLASNVSVVAAVAGLLSHNLFFIRGEHHLKAPLYIRLWCLFSAGFFVFFLRHGNGYEQALKETAFIMGAYLGPLLASMVIYRLIFHPLRAFPGPFMYKISKLWHVLQVAPSQQNFLVLDEMHRQYGDFVRTGK